MIRFSCAVLAAASLSAQTGSAGAAAAATKPGSISGTVTSVAGEPLRKAEVTLRSGGQRGGFAGSRGVPMPIPGRAEMGGTWAHTTDASGTFNFGQLPPGTYSLAVQKNGYVRSEFGRGGARDGGRTITLGPGQEIGGITIKLTPHGVITGKVTDEDGDPIALTSVQVLRERWIQGKRQMVPVSADSTNDLGEYRVAGLMPGRYHVMVTFNRPDTFRRPRPAGAQSDFGYTSVYYPGTFELSQAAQVALAPGQELGGIDFPLRKTATFRVRGKVMDETGGPAQQVAVMAMPAEGAFFAGMRGGGVVRNGSFEVAGLQPGNYTLIAHGGGGRGQARTFARQSIQVGARDLDGVVLALQPTFEITGTIRAPEGVILSGAQVYLDPMETGMPFGGGGSGQIESGAWKIQGAGPGRFRFFVNPLPEGTYLKSVSVQGQDITAGAMISSVASGVEITLGTNAPELNGTVVNKDKEPAPGATVVLVPDAGRQDQFWLFRTATTDQNGAFALRNISPGQYTAWSFSDVEDGAWHSAEFLKQYEGKGVKLSLDEKARESAALTIAQ